MASLPFTPGPWKLRKEQTPSGIPRIIIEDGFMDIGEVYTSADESFGWPDAHLMAAAPELLEAAVAMLEAFGDDIWTGAQAQALDVLMDAINKADGESPIRLDSEAIERSNR